MGLGREYFQPWRDHGDLSGSGLVFNQTGDGAQKEPENLLGAKTGVPMSVEEISEATVTSGVMNVYEKIADAFQVNRVEHRDWFVQRAEFLLKIAAEEYEGLGNRMLEVGCGTGSMIDFLVEREAVGQEIVGLDLTPKMIEIARSRTILPNTGGIDISYAVGNAVAVKDLFGENSFDSVISMFADIHVYKFRAALRSRFEVLRPNGVTLIMVPTNDRFFEYMHNAEKRNGTHTDAWWERKRTLLNSQGFLWLRETFPEMEQVSGVNNGVPTLFMMEEQWIKEMETAGFSNIGIYRPEVSDGYPRYMVIAGVAEKEG